MVPAETFQPTFGDAISVNDLRRMAGAMRRDIIEQSMRAGIGHIGSCLSIVDLLAALYGRILHLPSLDDPDRDRLLLSKGHAALALYAALHASGRLSTEELATYCANGSRLGGHPEHGLPGVELSTGSLGLGLGVGAGMALAARMRGSQHRVFVVMSDAELDEGSVWEAVMFSAHHRLSNLVAVVDANGQQALGYTRDVLDLSPLADRWRTFGWDVAEVEGHDPEQLVAAVEGFSTSPAADSPRVVIARTTFGKGVSYMESKIHWHYWPMSADEYARALEELAAAEQAPTEALPG